MRKSIPPLDGPLLVTVLALLGVGLVVLYSASTVEAYKDFGNTTYYILHQIRNGALLGLLGMYVLSRIDYHVWVRWLPILLLGTLILLVLVKIPGIGFSAGGATRWIHVGSVFFQPAELAKLVIVFYVAAWVDKHKHRLNDFYFGLLPSLATVALFAFLILSQPDFGTMFVLLITAFCILYAGGVSLRYFFWSTVSVGLLLLAFIRFEPYRARRLTSFLNSGVDPKGIGYQVNQALLAIGAGGVWGYGYGLSRQKYQYLPEAINDSIFAVMAEELGFFRVLLILGLFATFTVRGYLIARRAGDELGRLIAAGIVSWVALQAAINIAAMLNLLPLTGIPLPFFSYGSTSLMVTLWATGILLNVSRYTSNSQRG